MYPLITRVPLQQQRQVISALIEFSVLPVDSGASIGDALSYLIDIFIDISHSCRHAATRTMVEMRRLAVLCERVDHVYQALAVGGSKCVFAAIKLGISQGCERGLSGKIRSIEAATGTVDT